ncbi:hypothetical protein ACSNOI_03745 [Actinomadura kijaniata]|uniref:hypothetical protein n=1 Tax=Actinomadura kijaniata TaxID=46161 RepID=UPI003F1CC470
MNDNEVREEILRLLRDDLPFPAPAEFEQRPVVPLDRDVDGDIAVILVLRRGQAMPGARDLTYMETWTFQKRDGDWQELGGAGGTAPEKPLTRRGAAELGGHLLLHGWGNTVRNANRLLPWGAKYVHEARLQASDEVARIRIGHRTLEVPEHGHAVVVWGSRRAPRAEALSADGAVLEVLDLDRSKPTLDI